MTPSDPADIGRMIRRQGLPEAPRLDEQRSEVRSDCFVAMVSVPKTHTAFVLAPIFIQWRFRLTYERSVLFHQFLADNEQFIAESCQKVLQGVHYRGTYMGLSGQRAAYTTIWGYDTWEAQNQWTRLHEDRGGNFYRAVRDLRSFWTTDPDSTQEHFGLAAGIDLTREAFLAVTVDAERDGLAWTMPSRRDAR